MTEQMVEGKIYSEYYHTNTADFAVQFLIRRSFHYLGSLFVKQFNNKKYDFLVQTSWASHSNSERWHQHSKLMADIE